MITFLSGMVLGVVLGLAIYWLLDDEVTAPWNR